jgi:hypothetical protein
MGGHVTQVNGAPGGASVAQARSSNRVDDAVQDIRESMKRDHWYQQELTNGEIKDIARTVKGLSRDEAKQVFAQLSDAEIDKLTRAVDSEGALNFEGLSKDEKRDFVGDLAAKLDATQFARVARSFGGPQEIADVVAARGSTDAKLGFINAYKNDASSQAQPGAWYENIGGVTTRYGNESARAIGTVLGSLANDRAGLARAIGATNSATGEFQPGALSREQLRAVVDASMEQTSRSAVSAGGASLPVYSFSADRLNRILDAAATGTDAGMKAEVFEAAAQSLGKVQGTGGFLTPSADSHQEAAAISDHMGALLRTDTRGIIGRLEASDPTGNALTPFARQQLADGKTDNLRNMLQELRNGPANNALGHLGNVQNAQDLGYALGAVAAGLKSLSKSRAEQADLLNKLLGLGIGKIPQVSSVISLASENVIKNTVGAVADGTKSAPAAFYELMVQGLPAEAQGAIDAAMGRVINLQDLK